MKQYITFYIDNMLMGIDINYVGEINKIMSYTPIPDGPEMIKGLINLRGKIVTIFDMRKCLGIEPSETDCTSCNLILKPFNELKTDQEFKSISNDVVGFLADRIGNVENIDDKKIEKPPANINGIQESFILSVAEMEDELLIIPDIFAILSELTR